MTEMRAWAWFGSELASGLGLLGRYHWKYRREAPLGRIYRIGQRFHADSAVVEELVRRVPRSLGYRRLVSYTLVSEPGTASGKRRWELPLGKARAAPREVS
ncbi:hypothetical protein [Nannocystis pusilla]|uniref:hypothetical protein n=1 Tax=Nannocystis pusilla TaxID=889268 RepID=UPI003BF2552F